MYWINSERKVPSSHLLDAPSIACAAALLQVVLAVVAGTRPLCRHVAFCVHAARDMAIQGHVHGTLSTLRRDNILPPCEQSVSFIREVVVHVRCHILLSRRVQVAADFAFRWLVRDVLLRGADVDVRYAPEVRLEKRIA